VIGRDGLLVERGRARGLLLPQVAVRRGWDPEAFVSETCRKAGLPVDAWRDGWTVIRRFEAVCFQEFQA
ncbi:MAG: AMMECR1 family protein, partial [Acidobacteria bacterium]|nr:AMMECR1 family protein [Acidobacteriota bacterium]